MASKMLMLLAVLVALLVVSEARPGGMKGIPGGLPGGSPPRTMNMPIMPAGTYGPMPPYPDAGLPSDDDPDSLESFASDPLGSMGKLLGGGGGGGMKKLLIIG
ncbi:hypothetical protein DAPPUDRAFT_98095 [Daphnia pulex]|uniref:Uncharacterized protein n=1 Tax=Daphnia pulex TaxID=6669 RepID=E9G2B1_DAPPU|nr:hypothetical protein DAPPUDRAFT_98095 [Daphnia pulex]|eukprot:EFX86215.1 hypothetical protein DAPPUDRAFT_98095 [Daphnia pulex]